MPVARMAMHNSGEAIHVALWPTAHDRHQLASSTCEQALAFEGACFVLAVGLLMPRADLCHKNSPFARRRVPESSEAQAQSSRQMHGTSLSRSSSTRELIPAV